jgi:hypothetical protein
MATKSRPSTSSSQDNLAHHSLRQCIINWEVIGLQRYDLTDLDREISDEEIETVVRQTPTEKATGPDGYIGEFFKSYWTIVKKDVTTAIRDIFNLCSNCWNLLNLVNVTLIPKKDDAQGLGDYRPISVMHNIGKLVGKILANQLEPRPESMASHSQSAFIRRRSIQDNF